MKTSKEDGPSKEQRESRHSRSKRAVAIASIVLVGVAVPFGIRLAIVLKNKHKATETTAHMGRVEPVLRAFQPRDVSNESLTRLMKEHDDPRFLIDCWGNNLKVEVSIEGEPETYIYTIRSLGLDGREGPCCRGFVGHDWNADAVLRNGEWLQVW